jgi:hypothetical protein
MMHWALFWEILLSMAAWEEAVSFGGIVLAHVEWVIAELEDGSLLCPIAIFERAGEREVIAFEADTQTEAVERGKASSDEYRDKIDAKSSAYTIEARCGSSGTPAHK